MKNMKILGGAALFALTLSACSIGVSIPLTISNLQAPTVACQKETDGKNYLTLNFDYIGKISAIKMGFTPYGSAGNKATQNVIVANVDALPDAVKLPFPSSNKVTVKVNLADVAVSAAGVQPQGVTQPDPKTSYPMNITLSVSNTNSEQAGPLSLNGVDVGACYPAPAVP
jgi:hypothetical protein